MPRHLEGVLDRKFYDLSEAYKSRGELVFDNNIATQSEVENSGVQCFKKKDGKTFQTDGPDFETSPKLAAFIDENIIGKQHYFVSPFGKRKVVYCDYTASGKSLHCIEDYIINEVLPTYGNTHTTTSVTSLQTTLFRHEAREIFRNALGASEDDAVIFVGSGCTGAVHKLINGLHLTEPPIVSYQLKKVCLTNICSLSILI